MSAFHNLLLNFKGNQDNIPSDYLAYWKLAGNTDDETGNTITAGETAITSTTGKDGLADTAYTFSQSLSSNVLLPTTFLKSGLPATICAWINMSSTASGGIFGTGSQNAYSGISMLMQSGGYITGLIGGGSSVLRSFAISSNAIAINDWKFVSIVFNSYTSMDLYIDSVLQPKTTSVLGTSFSETSDTGTWMGSQNYGVNSFSFDGKISNVLLYGRALSLAEIMQINSN